MTDCSFCKQKLKEGTGKMYVKKDGKILYFCGMKCEKNMIKLGRRAREQKWTGFYQKGITEKKE